MGEHGETVPVASCEALNVIFLLFYQLQERNNACLLEACEAAVKDTRRKKGAS